MYHAVLSSNSSFTDFSLGSRSCFPRYGQPPGLVESPIQAFFSRKGLLELMHHRYNLVECNLAAWYLASTGTLA